MESAEHNKTNKNIEAQSKSKIIFLHDNDMFFIQSTTFKIEKFKIRILFRTPWYKSFNKKDLKWVYTQFSHDIEKKQPVKQTKC